MEHVRIDPHTGEWYIWLNEPHYHELRSKDKTTLERCLDQFFEGKESKDANSESPRE